MIITTGLVILFVVGICVLPLHAVMGLIGALATMIALLMVFSDFDLGIVLLGGGVALILLGIFALRKKEVQDEKDARETANRINRIMGMDLPETDDY